MPQFGLVRDSKIVVDVINSRLFSTHEEATVALLLFDIGQVCWIKNKQIIKQKTI